MCQYQCDACAANASDAGSHIFAWLCLSLIQFSSVVLHKRGYLQFFVSLSSFDSRCSGYPALAAVASSKGASFCSRHQQHHYEWLDLSVCLFSDEACSGRHSLQPLHRRLRLRALCKIARAMPRAGCNDELILKNIMYCFLLDGFSLQAAIVVVCISAVMFLVFVAFKIKRKIVYAQQIA